MSKTGRVRGLVVHRLRSIGIPFTIDDLGYENRKSIKSLLNQLVRKGEFKRIRQYHNNPSIYERKTS